MSDPCRVSLDLSNYERQQADLEEKGQIADQRALKRMMDLKVEPDSVRNALERMTREEWNIFIEQIVYASADAGSKLRYLLKAQLSDEEMENI